MVEVTHAVAIVVALFAALSVASQDLLIRKGTQKGESNHAVFIVIGVNLVVLLPLVSIIYYPDYGLTRHSIVSFIGAGIFGTVLGRVFKFASIARIGASRTSPIVASNAIIATVLGVVLLGESLIPIHAFGIILVVVGVAVISWETSHENPDNLSLRELLIGLLIPFGAAFAYGFEPIFANLGFAEGTPAPVGLVIKTVAASIGFSLYLRWQNSIPDVSVVRSRNTRWFVLAGLANTLFVLGYYVSLSIAPVNVVVPIIITNTLFVVLLSAFFMPRRLEQVTWRLVTAASVVVVGTIVISIFG